MLGMLTSLTYQPGVVQGTQDGWSKPVNLSHSGAATQPRLVETKRGLQAFWMDGFDGLTNVSLSGGIWSTPETADIPVTSPDNTPTFIVDTMGLLHALWIEPATNGKLYHSQQNPGFSTWTIPEGIADSVLVFEAAVTPSGDLSLVYIQTQTSPETLAGLYLQRLPSGGSIWNPPSPVYTSTYMRSLTLDQAWLSLAVPGDGTMVVVWQDAHLGKAVFASSSDLGLSWTSPHVLMDGETPLEQPRLVTLQDRRILLISQLSGKSTCQLVQQEFVAGTGVWTSPTAILSELTTCPVADVFSQAAGSLFWLWGEGSESLGLSVFDLTGSKWSVPQFFSFSFTDPETGREVTLGDLHVVLTGDVLAVIGSNQIESAVPEANAIRDVWTVQTLVSVMSLAYAPASPWKTPQRLSAEGQSANTPSLAVDETESVHIVWSQAASGSTTGSIFYAHWDARNLTRASEIISAGEGELARQPALLADPAGWLHLVWSGGEQGEILYSRARLNEVASPAGWSPPLVLSGSAIGAWPQIAEDPIGRIYVLYAVPINEGRGVYLVRSDDSGVTWGDPEVVFNAESAGWAMVDHPALAIVQNEQDSNLLDLHVAWVQADPPGGGQPMGIYYSRATIALLTPGEPTWSSPFVVVGEGYDWPLLSPAGGWLNLICAAVEGGIWQRVLPLAASGEDVSGWSTAVQIPGWQSLLSTQDASPYGLAVTGPAFSSPKAASTLHLVGGSGGGLGYVTWSGERWSSPEVYQPSTSASQEIHGAAAAARDTGGGLAVAYLATDSSGLPALYFTLREIPELEMPVLPTPEPTPTLVVTETPTVVPTVPPTPTPDLNIVTSSPGIGIPPLMLAGGLAAGLVILIFVVATLRRRQ